MALPHFCETQFSKEEKKAREAWFGWYLVSNDKLGYKIHILPKWFFKLNFFFEVKVEKCENK